jgi:hypothetical protein
MKHILTSKFLICILAFQCLINTKLYCQIAFTVIGPDSNIIKVDDNKVMVARSLAMQVMEGDKNSSMAALRKAILASGIAIAEEDKTLTKPERWQGFIFHQVELEALLDMTRKGIKNDLNDVLKVLTTAIPEIDTASLSYAFVSDLTTRPAETNFLRAFINELDFDLKNKIAEDLAGSSRFDYEHKPILINPIQFALLIQQLASELARTSFKNDEESTKNYLSYHGAPSTIEKTSYDNSGIINVALKDPPGSIVSFPNDNDFKVPACNDMDKLPFGADMFSLVSKAIFENSFKVIAKSINLVDKYESSKLLLKGVSLALTFLRVYISFSSVQVKMDIDKISPLIRTKTRSPGERRRLTATLKMDLGQLGYLRCARLALNAIGLDIKLPVKDGPISGADVQWTMVEGGQRVNNDWTINNPIVEFVNSSGTIQNAYGEQVKNFTRTKTDGNGQAAIMVEGAPQRETFQGKLKKVDKQYQVQLQVQLEPPSITSSVVSSVDKSGYLVGRSFAGPNPLTIIALMPELLLKTHWYYSDIFTYNLQDWEEDEDQKYYNDVQYKTNVKGDVTINLNYLYLCERWAKITKTRAECTAICEKQGPQGTTVKMGCKSFIGRYCSKVENFSLSFQASIDPRTDSAHAAYARGLVKYVNSNWKKYYQQYLATAGVETCGEAGAIASVRPEDVSAAENEFINALPNAKETMERNLISLGDFITGQLTQEYSKQRIEKAVKQSNKKNKSKK